MRSYISRLSILAACLALPLHAAAQDTVGGPISGDNTNANVQTGVNAAISTGQIGSNSRARSRSNSSAAGGTSSATGGSVTNNLSLGAGGGGAGGGGNTTATIRSAPPVFAPNLQGANPCTAGVSGGSSWVPFGFAFGAQWSERECRDQEWLRILASTGNSEAGRAYVCDRYPDLRRAFAASGTPCPQDAPRVQVAQQVSPAPVPPYCLRGRERGASDVLMREWNCP